METRAHHVLIGFFALAVAGGAMLFALWLTDAATGGNKSYDILFREAVTGLSVGSPVHYSGIHVGEVTNLRLDPRDPRKVWARISVSDRIPITEATRARLTIANITGASIIQLISGPPDSPPLAATDQDRVPVIEAEPSPLARLRSNSEELLVKLSRFMENANRMLSAENAGHITAILDNLETTTGAVAGREDAIREGLDELAHTGEQLNRTLEQTTGLVRRIDKEFAAHGPELFANADRTFASLRRLSDNLDRLVAANDESLGNSIRDLEPALRELRQALAALNRVAQRLEEDPSEYLLGGEKMEEYQP